MTNRIAYRNINDVIINLLDTNKTHVYIWKLVFKRIYENTGEYNYVRRGHDILFIRVETGRY